MLALRRRNREREGREATREELKQKKEILSREREREREREPQRTQRENRTNTEAAFNPLLSSSSAFKQTEKTGKEQDERRKQSSIQRQSM